MKGLLVVLLLLLLLLLESGVCGSYFYVTFHGGSNGMNNLYRYSLDGKPMGSIITNAESLRELRGMQPIGSSLLVCNAYKLDSRVVKVPLCGGEAETYTTSNLSHPYGIALNPSRDTFYTSNQNSGEISMFSVQTGQPIGSGSFAMTEDPRGIAVDATGNLYVASKGKNALQVFDSTGNLVQAPSDDCLLTLSLPSDPFTQHSKSNWCHHRSFRQNSLCGQQ